MTRQMVIRIDDETKERFQRVSRMEGKTASEKMRELIENYVRKADLSQVVDDLWDRIGAKANKQGVKARDVDRIIRETRASR
ncbi:MAG: ribbon-helix-helix protein, CopG family [Geobacter sp.]|nr:ribbon-helix-helix protein, CopG family [Geobacter sp.]